MPESTFEEDLALTKIREAYLKQQIEKTFGLKAIKSDMNQEFRGIDFTVNGQTIDLKWTPLYRPTYAVELLYLNQRNYEKLGWFIDNQHQTDICFFVECDQESQLLTSFTVSLKELREYVSQFISSRALIDMAHEMKHNNIRKQYINDSQLRLVYSSQLRERPVNLVIPKSEYKELSSYRNCKSWFGNIYEFNRFVESRKQA